MWQLKTEEMAQTRAGYVSSLRCEFSHEVAICNELETQKLEATFSLLGRGHVSVDVTILMEKINDDNHSLSKVCMSDRMFVQSPILMSTL